MRAIIRFSLDGDQGSALRNPLCYRLEQMGFQRAGNTATYENPHIGTLELAQTLDGFWTLVNQHQGPGRVDHFWMYTDRSDVDDLAPLE